jgi:hypothetical protein
MESVMEEEDIEDCIKRVNAVDNGIMIFAQNMNQKMENLKNTKKKYLDKLVDYKVFIGGDPSKEEKEKRFKDVEYLAREFKNQVKSLFDYDAGTKKFVDTIDRENEALSNQINNYKSTLKDIEKYIKNNPKKKDKDKKEEPKKEEPKKKKAGPEREPPKKEEPKKEEPKKEEPKKEEPKKEEPKKEETKKEEPKKEETKAEEPKKEETKKEEPKKEEPKKKKAGPELPKAGPEKEPPKKAGPAKEEPRSDVRFMSNIPLYLGSILPQEPSYIINHPERKEELLIGFKTGSCALAQLKGNQLAVSQEFPLKMGQIKNILVCQGKLCNGFYLVATEKKKAVSMVYPTVDKGALSMNQMLLTKMEEENPSLIEVGGEGKVTLTEFKKRDICAYCKSYIFLWQEKNEKYELHKINLDGDIDSLIQVGDDKILALLTRKSKFCLIDLTTLDKTYMDISTDFKISIRDDSSLIQLSNEYFLIDNGIKYDLFKYEDKLKYLQSFGKNASHVENYKKINNDTFILCEYFDGKRFFSKYKFSIKEGDVKFEMCGGPYMFDVAQRLQSFCVLGDELLAVVEKGTKKIYVFQINS